MDIIEAVTLTETHACDGSVDAEVRKAIMLFMDVARKTAIGLKYCQRIIWFLVALVVFEAGYIFLPAHPSESRKAGAARFKYTKALTDEYEGFVALDATTGQLCATVRVGPYVAGEDERWQTMRRLPSCEDLR